MVFDTHTHVPRFRERAPDVVPVANRAPGRPDKPVRWGVTWKDYIRDMGPVQKAIVCLIAGDPLAPKMGEATRSTAREANNETAEFVRTYPDRLVGFLTVHPRDPQCLEEIERATGDLGLKGIKLAPNYQNFDPRGEEAFRIFNRAQELRLPILLHQGTSPDAFADLEGRRHRGGEEASQRVHRRLGPLLPPLVALQLHETGHRVERAPQAVLRHGLSSGDG